MLCNECEKRSTCKKLCPKAERYVNQDYVPLRESLVTLKPDDDGLLMTEDETLSRLALNNGSWADLIADESEEPKIKCLNPITNYVLHLRVNERMGWLEIRSAVKKRFGKTLTRKQINNRVLDAKQRIKSDHSYYSRGCE